MRVEQNATYQVLCGKHHRAVDDVGALQGQICAEELTQRDSIAGLRRVSRATSVESRGNTICEARDSASESYSYSTQFHVAKMLYEVVEARQKQMKSTNGNELKNASSNLDLRTCFLCASANVAVRVEFALLNDGGGGCCDEVSSAGAASI